MNYHSYKKDEIKEDETGQYIIRTNQYGGRFKLYISKKPLNERLKAYLQKSNNVYDKKTDEIPSFMKMSDKPEKNISSNSDMIINHYFQKIKIKTKNQKIVDLIKTGLKYIPERDLKILENNKLKIEESKINRSYYRERSTIPSPFSHTICLNEKETPSTFAHEYAHFAADVNGLYTKKEFVDVLINSIKGSSYVVKKYSDHSGVKKEYIVVVSKKFVNEYQGRTYLSKDEMLKKGGLDWPDMKEYISIGYEYYIFHPEVLKSKDLALYNYFETYGLK